MSDIFPFLIPLADSEYTIKQKNETFIGNIADWNFLICLDFFSHS